MYIQGHRDVGEEEEGRGLDLPHWLSLLLTNRGLHAGTFVNLLSMAGVHGCSLAPVFVFLGGWHSLISASVGRSRQQAFAGAR